MVIVSVRISFGRFRVGQSRYGMVAFEVLLGLYAIPRKWPSYSFLTAGAGRIKKNASLSLKETPRSTI